MPMLRDARRRRFRAVISTAVAAAGAPCLTAAIPALSASVEPSSSSLSALPADEDESAGRERRGLLPYGVPSFIQDGKKKQKASKARVTESAAEMRRRELYEELKNHNHCMVVFAQRPVACKRFGLGLPKHLEPYVSSTSMRAIQQPCRQWKVDADWNPEGCKLLNSPEYMAALQFTETASLHLSTRNDIMRNLMQQLNDSTSCETEWPMTPQGCLQFGRLPPLPVGGPTFEMLEDMEEEDCASFYPYTPQGCALQADPRYVRFLAAKSETPKTLGTTPVAPALTSTTTLKTTPTASSTQGTTSTPEKTLEQIYAELASKISNCSGSKKTDLMERAVRVCDTNEKNNSPPTKGFVWMNSILCSAKLEDAPPTNFKYEIVQLGKNPNWKAMDACVKIACHSGTSPWESYNECASNATAAAMANRKINLKLLPLRLNSLSFSELLEELRHCIGNDLKNQKVVSALNQCNRRRKGDLRDNPMKNLALMLTKYCYGMNRLNTEMLDNGSLLHGEITLSSYPNWYGIGQCVRKTCLSLDPSLEEIETCVVTQRKPPPKCFDNLDQLTFPPTNDTHLDLLPLLQDCGDKNVAAKKGFLDALNLCWAYRRDKGVPNLSRELAQEALNSCEWKTDVCGKPILQRPKKEPDWAPMRDCVLEKCLTSTSVGNLTECASDVTSDAWWKNVAGNLTLLDPSTGNLIMSLSPTVANVANMSVETGNLGFEELIGLFTNCTGKRRRSARRLQNRLNRYYKLETKQMNPPIMREFALFLNNYCMARRSSAGKRNLTYNTYRLAKQPDWDAVAECTPSAYRTGSLKRLIACAGQRASEACSQTPKSVAPGSLSPLTAPASGRAGALQLEDTNSNNSEESAEYPYIWAGVGFVVGGLVVALISSKFRRKKDHAPLPQNDSDI